MSVLNINSKEDKLHVSFLLYANIWTMSQENKKGGKDQESIESSITPDFVACEQQRCRPVYISAQSD